MPAPHPTATREAAIDDYLAGDTAATVAARHGCSPSVVLAWVHAAGLPVRNKGGHDDDTDRYDGGWVLRGGIKVPTQPRRAA